MLLCLCALLTMTSCFLSSPIDRMAGQWQIGSAQNNWQVTITAIDSRSGQVSLYVTTSMTGRTKVVDFDMEACEGGIYRVPNESRVISVTFSGDQMILYPGFTGNDREVWTRR